VTPPHLRHNVVALGADYALFMVALAFVSPSTILPAFAAWLGAPNVVIGAIPAVMTLGWLNALPGPRSPCCSGCCSSSPASAASSCRGGWISSLA
jgi:hypothetical protein